MTLTTDTCLLRIDRIIDHLVDRAWRYVNRSHDHGVHVVLKKVDRYRKAASRVKHGTNQWVTTA